MTYNSELESWLLFLFSLFLNLKLELALEFDARRSMSEVTK